MGCEDEGILGNMQVMEITGKKTIGWQNKEKVRKTSATSPKSSLKFGIDGSKQNTIESLQVSRLHNKGDLLCPAKETQ